MTWTWLFVAIIYVAAIIAARRSGIEIPRRIAALFGVLVLFWLFAPLTGPYTIVPVDVIRLIPPWSTAVPATTHFTKYQVWNFEIQDIAMQIVPWAHLVRESWRSFDFPLWNPFAGCGYPLLANGQSQALSPLHLLTLPLSLGAAMTAEAAMKILIALVFTWLYCRRRYGPLPSAIGAIAFAFGTFVQTWLQFPIASVAVFLPATFLAIDLLIEKGGAGRLLFASLCGAAIAFSGHPETAAHMFFFATTYALWGLLVTRPHREARERMRAAGRLAAVFAVALLLALPFVVPFLESVTRSLRFEVVRTHARSGIPYSDLPSAILLLQPHFFGVVPVEVPSGPSAAEAISGFSGILGIAGWMALLIRGVTRRRWRSIDFFYVVAAALTLAVIRDWAPVSFAFKILFPYALNARVRLFFSWSLAVLTAAAIDDARRNGSLPLLAGLLFSSSLLFGALHRVTFSSTWMRDTAVLSILPSVVVIASALLFVLAPRRSVTTVLLSLAILFELWTLSRYWHPMLPARSLYPSMPLIDALHKLKARDREPFRSVGVGPAFFPNTPGVFGIEDVRVHDPMAPAAYVDFLRRTTGFQTREYYAKWKNTETRVLDYLNVKYVITAPGVDLPLPRYQLLYDARDGRIFENTEVMSRFYPALSVTAVNPTHYVLSTDARRETLIASSMTNYPGWRARSAGRTLRKVQLNGAFFGFVVPAGTTRVEVDYFPLSFYASLLISILTFAGLIAWCFMIRARV